MFRLTLLPQAIALCFFFGVLQTGGVRFISKENDSSAQGFIHGPTKRILTSLKSNSVIGAITSRQESSSWDDAYFAGHQTSPGGPNDNYYGLYATMDVYGFDLKPGQWSSTTFWITHTGDGNISSYNVIEVGWHIRPDRYGDSAPHFYTYWMRDGYDATGCMNMDCPGFVVASGAAIAPGAAIHPVSDYPDGPFQKVTLKVLKDNASGDWWVYYGFNNVIPTGVGYFPRSLFSYLAPKANGLGFGAFVRSKKRVPTPPMGSGVLPNGVGAASFADLRTIDQGGISHQIMTDWPKVVTDEKCYSIDPIEDTFCLYGGPGDCFR